MIRDFSSSIHRSWRYFIQHITYHQVRAAALVYYTILALLPFFTLMLLLARPFNLNKQLAHYLLQIFTDQKEIFSFLLNISFSVIAKSKGLLYLGSAVLLYVWSSFSIIDRLERHLNQLLKITAERTLLQRLLAYPLMLLFFPLAAFLFNASLFSLISTLNLFFSNPLFFFFLHLLSPLLTALLIGIAYVSIPNGKVEWRYAFYSGLIAAVIYQFFQWGYFYFQLRVLESHPFLGSFVILPLFLLWLNLNWLIFLLGGEILAILHENKPTFHPLATPKH